MLRGQERHWIPGQVNADLYANVAVRATDMTWFETEFNGIWFAPYEADGSVQNHPVTMLTRMEPGSFFPLHGHPGGEEVLVVQGVFEDDTGIYPAGSYLVNPEGFEHRPFTREGCITFVKLRQHGGAGRLQLRTSLDGAGWRPAALPGVTIKPLYEQDGFPERTWAERWAPGTAAPSARTEDILEVCVLDGTWQDETGTYHAGSWLRYVPGDAYRPSSPDGCTLYVKSYPLHSPRYIVNPGFRHPDGSLPS